jgi:hypothetical protein
MSMSMPNYDLSSRKVNTHIMTLQPRRVHIILVHKLDHPHRTDEGRLVSLFLSVSVSVFLFP